MKKWITYARTIWHEFWMYMLVGPATPDSEQEGLAPRPGAQELLYDISAPPSTWTGPGMGPYKDKR